jgi:hypothetical protein
MRRLRPLQQLVIVVVVTIVVVVYGGGWWVMVGVEIVQPPIICFGIRKTSGKAELECGVVQCSAAALANTPTATSVKRSTPHV